MAGTLGLFHQDSEDHCHYDLIPPDYDLSKVKKNGSSTHTSVKNHQI